VLAEREATARAQRCSDVWGDGVNGSVGLALLRFALPPPPPPPFLALPPPLLWAKAVTCLAQLCCHSSLPSSNHQNSYNSHSSALRALSEEAHVSAAPLPHPAALAAAAMAAATGMSNGLGLPPSTPSPSGNGVSSASSIYSCSSTGISLLGNHSGSQVSFGPDVTLSGLGCAVRWLLLGPDQVSAALAASADASQCGGPPGSKYRRHNRESPTAADSTSTALTASSVEGSGADGATNGADNMKASEADQGTRAVLGAMLNLVANAATSEGPGGCLMAVSDCSGWR